MDRLPVEIREEIANTLRVLIRERHRKRLYEVAERRGIGFVQVLHEKGIPDWVSKHVIKKLVINGRDGKPISEEERNRPGNLNVKLLLSQRKYRVAYYWVKYQFPSFRFSAETLIDMAIEGRHKVVDKILDKGFCRFDYQIHYSYGISLSMPSINVYPSPGVGLFYPIPPEIDFNRLIRSLDRLREVSGKK